MNQRKARTGGGIAGEPLTRGSGRRMAQAGTGVPRRAARSGRRRVEVGEQEGPDGCHRHGSGASHSGFTLSSSSHVVRAGRLGYSVFGFVMLQRIRPKRQPACRLAWICIRLSAPDPGAAGGNQPPWGALPCKLRRLPWVIALNSRQINHLRHTMGVAHYSQLPALRGGLIRSHAQQPVFGGSPTHCG